MKLIDRYFDAVCHIKPEVHEDNRGTFYEWYNKNTFTGLGIKNTFIQDNHALSRSTGTIRGMHYQQHPKAQSKLIRVVRGSIYNVFVDIRQGSPTFMKWKSVELYDSKPELLYVPAGFAYGYCTLTDNTEMIYKVDNYRNTQYERSFAHDDPVIAIDWPVADPVLSEKDKNAALFKEIENNFKYEMN